MARHFKVGDHVSWNSEAGRVSGRIVKVHTRNVDYKGYTHHASPDEPQYEIKSDESSHRPAQGSRSHQATRLIAMLASTGMPKGMNGAATGD